MRFNSEINIEGSAEAAWEVLGLGYGEICQWTNSLVSSTFEGELAAGGTRTCKSGKNFGPFKGGAIVKERLTLFDPIQKTFAYEALSETLPSFVRKAGNRWSIHKIDEDNCVVRIQAYAEFAPLLAFFSPLFRLLLKKDFEVLVQELQYRIKFGKPHPEVVKNKKLLSSLI